MLWHVCMLLSVLYRNRWAGLWNEAALSLHYIVLCGSFALWWHPTSLTWCYFNICWACLNVIVVKRGCSSLLQEYSVWELTVSQYCLKVRYLDVHCAELARAVVDVHNARRFWHTPGCRYDVGTVLWNDASSISIQPSAWSLLCGHSRISRVVWWVLLTAFNI